MNNTYGSVEEYVIAGVIGEAMARSLEERLIDDMVRSAVDETGAIIFVSDNGPILPAVIRQYDWQAVVLPVTVAPLFDRDVHTGSSIREAIRGGALWYGTIVGRRENVRDLSRLLHNGGEIRGVNLTVYGSGHISFVIPANIRGEYPDVVEEIGNDC